MEHPTTDSWRDDSWTVYKWSGVAGSVLLTIILYGVMFGLCFGVIGLCKIL